MKNLKRVLSVVLAMALCLMSTVAFAAPVSGDETYNIELVPSKTEVAPGETFSLGVYITKDGDREADIDFSAVYGEIDIAWTGDVTVDPSSTVAANGWSTKDFATGNGRYVLLYDNEIATTLNANSPYAVITCTAGESGDIVFTSSDEGIVDTSSNETLTVGTAGTCTVKVADPTPEIKDVEVVTGETGIIPDFTVGDVTYKNLWVGNYTLTPDGKAFKINTVNVAGNKNGEAKTAEFESGVDTVFDGEGSIEFKVALTGVDDAASMLVTLGTAYVD